MVSIIIINYNTFQLTCNCIASVLQHTKAIDFEIILVDNASTECDPQKFKEQFPGIHLIESKQNTGFAGGNNLGIKQAKGEIILLLNSDTYLTEDAISFCASQFSKHDNAGVVGCKMIYPDGGLQYTARKFRTLQWELLDLFRPVLQLMSYKKRAQLMLGRYFKADFDTECDWLNGAFFMFSKKLLTQMPDQKLDDRFFMYGEDHLWCMQIKKMGLRNLFFSGTQIVHINSGSTDKNKQLALKKIMLKHELEIMNTSGMPALNLQILKFIYITKENLRYLIKKLVYKLSGKLIR